MSRRHGAPSGAATDTGEEQGLWSTWWFVHRPPVLLANAVAHLNADMIGASRSAGGADAQSADVNERGEVFVLGPRIGVNTGIHARYHLPADEAQHLDPVQMRDIAPTILESAWALADAAERPRIDKPLPQGVPKYR